MLGSAIRRALVVAAGPRSDNECPMFREAAAEYGVVDQRFSANTTYERSESTSASAMRLCFADVRRAIEISSSCRSLTRSVLPHTLNGEPPFARVQIQTVIYAHLCRLSAPVASIGQENEYCEVTASTRPGAIRSLESSCAQ